MTDDFDTEARADLGLPFPLLAILVGGALLVAATLLAPHLIARPPFATLLLGGLALGLLLWIVAMVAGVRRSGLLWQVGALVALLAGGAAAGYGANRLYYADAARDASSFAEADLATDGTPTLPRGAADRGPVSRAYVDAIAAEAADARAYAQALGALGPGALNSPHVLAQSPAILDRCDAIGPLAARAEAAVAGERARAEALSVTLARSALSAEVKRGIARMIAARSSDAVLDARLAHERARIETTEALCRLLAKRSWRNAMGYFAFSNPADTAAFDRITAARRAGASARAVAERDSRDAWLAGQALVRDALSR